MNMNVNQAGKNRFAFGLDHFRVHRLRVGPGSFIDLSDLAGTNQDGSGFNNLAVSDEDARAANQIRVAASQLPVENLGLRDAATRVHLPTAQQKERSQD